MLKRTKCDSRRSDYCAGREYEGLGFNNEKINAEFVHNMDYSTTPPSGQNMAFYVIDNSIYPGRKRKRINMD